MTQLTIIQQNDTHGYIESHEEFFWKGDAPEYRQAGGFARIARIVKEIRKNNSNVLFVDSGDFLHGTGPSVLTRGSTIVPLLNALEIDAAVPGNWDFAYGSERLLQLQQRLAFPMIAFNLKHKDNNSYVFKPYIIKETDSLRLGIIGLTYPYVHETMPPSFSGLLSFSLGTEDLPAVIQKLKKEERVDLIIVVSHLGLPLDVKLASQVPGIDIILSGHSHDRLSQPIIHKGCIIIQSGASGSFLGKLVVSIEQGKLTDYKHELIPIYADRYEEDAEMKFMIDESLFPFRDQLSEAVGTIRTPLHRMTLQEAPMDRLITDAYLAHMDADVSFSHGWRYGAPVLPGIVTMNDLYNMIPTNPELFILEMDGASLFSALERNLEQVFAADPYQQKGGYILRSSNLMMAYKPYNPQGHRIQHMEIKGKLVQGDRIYRIAGAGEQLFMKHSVSRKMQNVHAHDVLKEYFARKGEITINDSPFIISI
ncbi:bifunctional metallophosphatase/5'-nucleotidase [Paenibacillus tianjinensis]|uniref:5'-nucleotidase C-terminal domain-containing protein n=1 Tax=Paenibacillus tianjinensis TaxID=2810347 RepID=A0ABX7L6A4_9BACL|nr:bifunctional metallophosphatase/5'-nucleotidase [Paenibacillus tianjinensis]QSF42469.1 5'-nucleotidase C-terminal domain-containing protein [Paenibacillus tianjinensis]